MQRRIPWQWYADIEITAALATFASVDFSALQSILGRIPMPHGGPAGGFSLLADKGVIRAVGLKLQSGALPGGALLRPRMRQVSGAEPYWTGPDIDIAGAGANVRWTQLDPAVVFDEGDNSMKLELGSTVYDGAPFTIRVHLMVE